MILIPLWLLVKQNCKSHSLTFQGMTKTNQQLTKISFLCSYTRKPSIKFNFHFPNNFVHHVIHNTLQNWRHLVTLLLNNQVRDGLLQVISPMWRQGQKWLASTCPCSWSQLPLQPVMLYPSQCVLFPLLRKDSQSSQIQHAKKAMRHSPGLVDFALRPVYSVLHLPVGQVRFPGNIFEGI